MAVCKILKYPNPILRTPTEDWVWEQDDELRGISLIAFKRYATDMLDTLLLADRGAALAANQIGIKYRMFAINPELASRNGLPTIIVNPRILEKSPEKVTDHEGCLSFPGIHLPISRHQKIKVEFESDNGKHTVELENFIARLFQHEIDHLEGKLFVDFLPHKKRFEIRTRMLKGR